MTREPTPADIIAFYHERTKHHLHRYAAGPEHLDWAAQPDPFRRYRGAPLVHLPLPPLGDALPYDALYARDAGLPAAPLAPATVSRFLRYSLSLTAWKEFRGTRWALRANPSSGNLHPTEGYLVLPAMLGLGEELLGVHHYAPREHALELRAVLAAESCERLVAARPAPAFLVGLTSIHWREAWKYGERAYRYCQHDVGHALAALRLAAAALGWTARLIHPAGDERIAALLGIDRPADYPGGAEREAPDLLLAVSSQPPAGGENAPALAGEPVRAAASSAAWQGIANVLSPDHAHDWPLIELVATAAADHADDRVSAIHGSKESYAEFPDAVDFPTGTHPEQPTAETVILGRRSAVAMDGSTAIDAAAFYRMLARLVPGRGNATPPWDALPWRPRIHLALFVHRVDGLAPGLYALARDPEKMDLLRAAMRADFTFAKIPGAPAALPLRHLTDGDLRATAATISCHQAIAGGGAFSLGMLAEMRESLAAYGPSFYRRLYWEAGMVGQVLYLEAEAAGVRATGIGCYFDDAMHHLLGLKDDRLQSFYHLSVGGPVEDTRLTTLPAYGDRGAEG